jgi:hypothetical protein
MSVTTSIRKHTDSDFTQSCIITKYRVTRKSQQVLREEIKGDLEDVITARAHYKCGNTCPRKIKMEP